MAAADLLVHASLGKHLDWPRLLQRCAEARAAHRTVVWTNGCFDLLHAGHVRNLQAARQMGDLLVVGVNSDASVERLKGPGRPIIAEAERVEMLAALACVDYVIVFAEDTPHEMLVQLRPEIHCKGAEYAPPSGKPMPERGVIEAYGGRIEFLPMVPGASTSELIRRIRRGEAAAPRGD